MAEQGSLSLTSLTLSWLPVPSPAFRSTAPVRSSSVLQQHPSTVQQKKNTRRQNQLPNDSYLRWFKLPWNCSEDRKAKLIRERLPRAQIFSRILNKVQIHFFCLSKHQVELKDRWYIWCAKRKLSLKHKVWDGSTEMSRGGAVMTCTDCQFVRGSASGWTSKLASGKLFWLHQSGVGGEMVYHGGWDQSLSGGS